MTAGPPNQPDLSRARASVLAIIAGSPMGHRPPTVLGAAPLRPLPPAVQAKIDAQPAVPTPEQNTWRRVVVPSAALAVVDAIALISAVLSGSIGLAIGAAVLFVLLAGIAVFGARFASGRPGQLTLGEQSEVRAASRWRSKQAWTGPYAAGRERGLVIAAAQATERISRTPIWRSGRFDDARLRLDLVRELDQIDEQAHRIAQARHEQGGLPGGPALDQAWESAVTRVAALTAYADELEGYGQRRATVQAEQGDPVRDSDLLAGSVKDEYALTELLALTYFLGGPGGRGLDL